jgi:hypothetical protein
LLATSRPSGDHSCCVSSAGSGDGRIYTITYRATNACGNTATKTATVTVPHDRRK